MQIEIIDNSVHVQETHKGKGVFAIRDFQPGETVIVGRRVEVLPQRTLHSLQMDFDLHVELDEPARLLNHSCNPNTGVRNNQFGGYDFVALVNIAKGDEITWDYETTEYISIAVSKCLCGHYNCRNEIRGFKFFHFEIKQKYGQFIADYLK